MISPDFSAVYPLAGGALIGLSVSLYLLTHGRVAGISGLFAAVLNRSGPNRGDAVAFVGGILLVGAVATFLASHAFDAPASGMLWTAVAGLLVGFGTRLGNGCTSGHGVCGVSRLSIRSILATLVFITTGVMTVTLARLLGVHT